MQKRLLRILKVFLSAGIVIVIFRYFLHFENLPKVWQLISEIPLYIFSIAILAAIINWGLESKKWQILVLNIEPFSYFTAIKSTTSGAAVSNILPFRIGEYLGRVVYIKPENRVVAAFNSVLGSTAQFCVSIIIGIPAILMMMDEKYRPLALWSTITLLGIFTLFGFTFYFFKNHTQFRSKWLQKLVVDIKKFTWKQIVIIFSISFLRYAVFSSFYVFLLLWFQITPDILFAYAGVASVYFLQSFAPSMILTDAGLRTALPLLVFHANSELESSILAAALVNYFFNILLPSLVGLYFIVVEKIKTA